MKGRRLAITGAVLGVVLALSMLVVGLFGFGPEIQFEPLGRAATGVVLLAPFVLALAVARAGPAVRAGVWLGAGLVALWIGVASFSIFIAIALPAAILLIVGGSLAMGEAHTSAAVALMVAVLVVGVGSSVAGSLTQDPHCWERVRTSEGLVWVENTSPGLGQTLRPAEFASVCVSDVTTPVETGVAIGAWAVLALGVTVAARAEHRKLGRDTIAGATT